jgi:hypothetical protein
MATYKVKNGQNIWDVALDLCGTIEGVFDLLISNSWLNIADNLVPGTALEYHEDFVINPGIVSGFRDERLTPANAERHVYHKQPAEPLRFIVNVAPTLQRSSLTLSGDGALLIDWGDNTPLETISLTSAPVKVEHYFDNLTDNRRIRIYGNCRFQTLDASEIGGALLVMTPVTVDEFTSHANGHSLLGLYLFEGTVKLDLRQMYLSDLMPIVGMSLQELDLRQAKFTGPDNALDAYLQAIVANYGHRRSCTVRLDTTPSDAGMEAIRTIINEESWNQDGAWTFIINDTVYTAAQSYQPLTEP